MTVKKYLGRDFLKIISYPLRKGPDRLLGKGLPNGAVRL